MQDEMDDSYLNSLPVIPEHVHAHDRLVEVRICALRDIVVQMLFVAECVHALEDELE